MSLCSCWPRGRAAPSLGLRQGCRTYLHLCFMVQGALPLILCACGGVLRSAEQVFSGSSVALLHPGSLGSLKCCGRLCQAVPRACGGTLVAPAHCSPSSRCCPPLVLTERKHGLSPGAFSPVSARWSPELRCARGRLSAPWNRLPVPGTLRRGGGTLRLGG